MAWSDHSDTLEIELSCDYCREKRTFKEKDGYYACIECDELSKDRFPTKIPLDDPVNRQLYLHSRRRRIGEDIPNQEMEDMPGAGANQDEEESAGDEVVADSAPRFSCPEDLLVDFKSRRKGILKALTTGIDFSSSCFLLPSLSLSRSFSLSLFLSLSLVLSIKFLHFFGPYRF